MSASNIWETLSKVDVSKRIEKKADLSYLSWAWAWGELMKHYPKSNYTFKDNQVFDDGSVTVWCTLTVTSDEESITRDMWLPVMDNRNRAVISPDARKISDSQMRCLVKAIAMFGLGHYIYAGEDLPSSQADPIENKRVSLDPSMTKAWANAIMAFKRDGNTDAITERVDLSDENKALLIKEAGASNEVS